VLVAANRATVFGVAARWVLHDLRSPAQSLTLLADLLADPDTEIEPILRESCNRLGRSLDLLSRVLHATDLGEIGPISVQEPIQFIHDLHHAGRTGVRLEVAVDPAVHAAAGIERHLEHALLNLVLDASDAVEHQKDGVIRITAGNDGNRVEIVVAEMAPDRPAGDGLVVAGEVLRLSGGALTWAPGSQPGARFVITLPRWRGTE